MNYDDRRRLPPMAMLHCFEAAARLGSFTRAGEALRLTQSAVSRHVSNLEQWLGAALFDRNGRRVVLNDTGRQFLEDLAPALSAIRRAAGRLMDPEPEHVIELAVLPGFGMRWLAPRLPRLTQKHPDLVVNISARTDIFDFAREPFHAAIHVGGPDWPGAEHDLLFHEHVVPVVSPAVQDKYAITRPEDFLRVPLLVQSRRKDAWSRWFALTGVPAPEARSLPSLSHFLMLAQSAKADGGAALLPSFLIAPELEAGELVIPVNVPLPEDRSYWLAFPEASRKTPALMLFRDWIREECGLIRPSGSGQAAG
ncbi:LysR substrate-binding domain-containing protein [Novosphingobium beihaiensis]|uniref:LysR substrate-binding domain-containing protein n=1 Tax=Novosphingobium beihaiensis TaxID=2930389 RepID=A0ABT0BQS9_9SPHN|nr:LysR substrate-binding domain-containing protein [Novosphingobium beihaiensis]MCJ2187218.1 LysR substrate-binding domain-containing protein [Novosphingobium beihaiensis]